ncbi:hypothetical protein [Campylobacter sp. JMF_03 NE3]|uniref:hypothetical protein n=1 Tax=Campylobacter sp. JMF_03 NE3 TaxID=2983831 RepID=UPI0022E9A18A|nr:hypothetical protein [Campylobacter sp. JMF_03 NE3]MDA3053590.1 hypothetical protein [Campylobacter sp. JMF_03 NE3]
MINSKNRVSKSFTLAKELDEIWSKLLIVNKDAFIRYAISQAVNDENLAPIFFGNNVEKVKNILNNSDSSNDKNNNKGE